MTDATATADIASDIIYAGHARRLHDAVADRLPHSFREGKVLVTIRAVEREAHRFSVLDAEASFDGHPVELDLPLHYLNATADHPVSPLGDVHAIIAATVRHFAAEQGIE